MIRQLLALLLVVTTVSSSAFAQTSDTASPVLVDRKTDYPYGKVIKIVRRENKLRKGHDAEFAVALSTSSPNCGECLPALLEEGDYPILKSLRLNTSEGFSVRYAKPSAREFESLPQGIPVNTQRGFSVLLKVHADKNLKAGDYTLKGKASLMIMHRGEANHEKEVDVVIPITVVDNNEAVSQNNFAYQPYPEHHVGNVLRTLIIIPLYLPLLLLWMIACSVSDDECS